MIIRGVTLLLLVLALAALAAVLALALFGSENLLLAALKDDGFYFLALARNLAHGNGVTFDGLGPTNGFHPLWLLLLTPIFWFDWSSLAGPIRALLLLSLVLHTGAGLAVHRAARLLVSPGAARVAALFYLCNPLVLYLVVSGMESPAAALIVALLIGEAIRLRSGGLDLARPRAAIRLGLLGGLCMLARTDLVLLVACVLASALLPLRREGGRRRLWLAVRAGIVSLAVVLPWIAWNLARFGTLVQVSARAHHLHSVHLRAADEPRGVAQLLTVGRSVVSGVLHSASARAGIPPLATGLLLLGAAAIAAWWIWAMISPRAVRREFVERAGRILAPAVYAAGFLAACFFVLGHIRSWYLAGPLVVAGVCFSLPLEFALRAGPSPRGGRPASALLSAGVALVLFALGPLFAGEILENGRRLHVWKDAARWAEAHTSPGDRVASFNSGTFGYLSPRVVVNLDCVVNNRALPWLERRRLVEFLRRERIRYLIDDPWYVQRYFSYYGEPGWPAHVSPVDTLPRGLIAWRVRGDE